MAGNIPRWYLKQSGAAFLDLPNDEELAVKLSEGALGDFDIAIYARESWDSNFKGIGGTVVYSNNMEVVSDILTTGNLWDTGVPTWRDLLNNGAQYPGPDGLMTGQEACIQRLSDWLKEHTTADCEASTRQAWFINDVLAWLQPILNSALAGWVREAAPSEPPPPQTAFPPQIKGTITNPMGLVIAQSTLVRLTMANNVPTLTMLPTPE